MLNLTEELFVLSIHEDKGTVIASAAHNLQFGLGGAILAELALLGKVGVRENHRLTVLEPAATGDVILDNALQIIQASEKERKVGYWIDELSQKPEKFRKRLTEQLQAKGVIAQDEERIAWVIPFSPHPELNASAKYWIKNRLRSIILAGAEASLSEITLLSLVMACGFIDLVFVRDERKIAIRRIHEMVVAEALKNPVAQTIEEIEAAIAAVVEED